jgi:DNA-binding MarR family transcriptional regulator
VAAILEPYGITAQQYNVLRILRGAGERGLPTLDIVERLIEETPGITRLIDRLEEKQLVARERCLTDRRQVFCRITKEGLKLLAKLDVPLNSAEEDVLGHLKKRELDELVDLLDRAREGLNQKLVSLRRKP